MKTIFTILFLFMSCTIVFAQSPQVDIKFRFEEIMYHGDTCESVYTVVQERCLLLNPPVIKEYIKHDTSKINWKNTSNILLKSYACMQNDSQVHKAYVFNYKYSGHEYVYENIFRFTIVRQKCGNSDTMRFIFPVKISSFVTYIDLGKVYFSPHDYDFTDNFIYNIDEYNYLHIIWNDEMNPAEKYYKE